MRILRIIALITSLAASTLYGEPATLGTITGVVTDSSGAGLPGVTINLAGERGESDFAVSSLDGGFTISGVTPGSYTLEAMMDGFQSVSKAIDVVSERTAKVEFKLQPAFGESVEVVGDRVPTGEVATLETRRQSAIVSDAISSEEIRKTPDSSAAGVVERLAGVSLVGEKYVFVRGLGERYSAATVNGAALPTTETEKRVVPLDLFPAKLLESVSVAKTFTPDKPGDFGAGVVEMTTTEFPSEATLKLSVGGGYRSGSTGEPFRRFAGGLSRFGEGGQSLPSSIPASFLKRRNALDPSGFSAEELERIGEAFIGSWAGENDGAAAPSTDFALTYGNTFDRLGLVLSAVSSHGSEVIDETQAFFGLEPDGTLVPRNDYAMNTHSEHARLGLMGNIAFRLTDANRIHLSSLFTRDASVEDRAQEGLNTNTGGFIRDFRARYQVEEVLSSRLRGEHSLVGPGSGTLLEWGLSSSRATNESNLRENLYRESSPGLYALQVGFPESGKLDYHDLDDRIEQAQLATTFFMSGSDNRWSGSFKGGVDVLDRARSFEARRFRFATANQLQFDLTQAPEQIFTVENIRPGGFEIREVTGVNDAYDAAQAIRAGYLMADFSYGRWRLIGGARLEDSDQDVITFNPFDTASEVVSTNHGRDVLPSLNIVYSLGALTNLRLAYGRSLNRPEFRELSPFTFVEVTGGRSVAGNPLLQQATIDAFDIRWERFPAPGAVVAASLFYKSIDDPIERIVQPTTELRTSFVNADLATLSGLELELRRSLEILSPKLRLWSVNLNYARIHSDVTVGDQQLSVVTNLERPLEGQSDQVGNLALQFFDPQRGTMLRILGSFTGERITDVGAFGLPDIIQEPVSSLDLVASQSLGPFAPGIELKLAASNVLDASRQWSQGDRLQRAIHPGRTFSLSLSYTPF
ncbi:MAG TPA: TonB-dependent receptor [Thermoanaerobaculia bacterium]|nr:TonB-dependent receptor [Thermoanaerobaculia bacterium]